MSISINLNNNCMCLFQGDIPPPGKIQAMARAKWPNAHQAEKAFCDHWRETGVGMFTKHHLDLYLFLDHCGGLYTTRYQKLAKRKTGYSAGIVMMRHDLMDGSVEKGVAEIRAFLDNALLEILERPTLAKDRP